MNERQTQSIWDIWAQMLFVNEHFTEAATDLYKQISHLFLVKYIITILISPSMIKSTFPCIIVFLFESLHNPSHSTFHPVNYPQSFHQSIIHPPSCCLTHDIHLHVPIHPYIHHIIHLRINPSCIYRLVNTSFHPSFFPYPQGSQVTHNVGCTAGTCQCHIHTLPVVQKSIIT